MDGDKRKGKKGVFYLFTFDVVGNGGPFDGEVDGGHRHGPSLVIRSPLRRLVWVQCRQWSDWWVDLGLWVDR